MSEAETNSWRAVWNIWKEHPGLRAVAEEHARDGNYSCASILNDWIGRLLEATEADE